MSILLVCTAVLVLFYTGLSFNVSRIRRKRRNSPEITEAQLTKAIRAHGNASEYIPLLVALFLFFHVTGPGPAATALAMVATASRISHGAGMLRAADASAPHPLRFWGALGSYVCLFGFGVLVLMGAF